MSLLANALALLEIYLTIWLQNVEIIEFLANFHQISKVSTLHIAKSADVMVPSELKGKIPSPLSNLELLTLGFDFIPTIYTISEVVDNLLWFAPHAKTVSVHFFSSKFTYKKQLIYEGKTASCFKSLPVLCWHHCIEVVKVKFTNWSNFINYTFSVCLESFITD
ncbi:hypothetical protein Dsin_032099 [Dipteronia sinensis]|uniref:Uncharacterized protein n=1 Tax=Dipteronia sinensis TaxID=43782 RepID=A0AAD9ZN64_9ROSI|nr:hypothetical protein Dsin_032099 [Dipteronia sinensis]